jgi:hypothetical protein
MTDRPATPDLDIEQPAALLAYLRETGRIGPSEEPRIDVLPGGVSNRTVLVERPSGEAWVLKQALAKLRVQVDWFSSPARIEREALGLTHLAELAPPGTITPLVFFDLDRFVLAMAAVPQPHENWKRLLLAGRLERDHVARFARLLGTIHREAATRPDLAGVFADRSFFESLRLEPYFGFAAEQVPEAAPFLHDLIATTRARCLTLVHGDYSPKNVLIQGDRLVLLDHEVIHRGDPAFDLGFALTHLLSKAHHLPEHRAAFLDASRQFWRVYGETVAGASWADELEPYAVRSTLGILLARVAGRSPLEYLDAGERARQQAAVLAITGARPETVADLVTRFAAAIAPRESSR